MIYTAYGHKLHFFTLRKSQFVTVPNIVSIHDSLIFMVPFLAYGGITTQ